LIEDIRPGLKRWAVPHPDWKPEEDDLDESYRDVASILFDGDDALVVIDPLVPDELWPELDAEVKQSGKPVVVLTTIGFHARSREELARRYGARLGGDVPGVSAFSAERGDEVTLWLEEPRALVFGDAILGDQAGGLRLTPWSQDAAGLERTRSAARKLLELDVDVVLPAHGNPVLSDGKAALAKALDV
jgi:glyoxylase-like metal-dependent hydrolase (beta-lactamase superfamily II)